MFKFIRILLFGRSCNNFGHKGGARHEDVVEEEVVECMIPAKDEYTNNELPVCKCAPYQNSETKYHYCHKKELAKDDSDIFVDNVPYEQYPDDDFYEHDSYQDNEIDEHNSYEDSEIDQYDSYEDSEIDEYDSYEDSEIDENDSYEDSEIDEYDLYEDSEIDEYGSYEDSKIDEYDSYEDSEIDEYDSYEDSEIDEYGYFEKKQLYEDEFDYEDNEFPLDSNDEINDYDSYENSDSGESHLHYYDEEQVERNDVILIGILNSFLEITDDYSDLIRKGSIYKRKYLPSSESEYTSIKNNFDSCMKRGTQLICRNYRIRKIEKILCPYLLAQFKIKEGKKRDEGVVFNQELYHGTARANVSSICRNNFDWRRCGTHVGTKFGKGISLAKYATWTSFYPKIKERPRTMFVTNILYVRKQHGNAGMAVPDEGYDATTNGNGDVVVKYDDGEFCPLYLQINLQASQPQQQSLNDSNGSSPSPFEDDIDAALNNLQTTLEGSSISTHINDITSVPELKDQLRFLKPKRFTLKAYKKYWFTCRDLHLYMYKGREDMVHNINCVMNISLKGCEVTPDVVISQNKYVIKLEVPSADGMSEMYIRCDDETQYSRWMACCRLAAKGRSLADSSYETEKQTILEFLNLQRRAEEPVLNPSSLDIQVDDYIAPKYLKKSRGKLTQRIVEAHTNVKDLSLVGAKMNYIKAWQLLPDFGITLFAVKFMDCKKEELLGVAYNRIMKMDIGSGDHQKTWRFNTMKAWNVNWEIKHMMVQFEEGNIIFSCLSADCKVVHEFIGGYIFLSTRSKDASQTLNEELFHKLTGGWS